MLYSLELANKKNAAIANELASAKRAASEERSSLTLTLTLTLTPTLTLTLTRRRSSCCSPSRTRTAVWPSSCP